jgi:hypothetical protein
MVYFRVITFTFLGVKILPPAEFFKEHTEIINALLVGERRGAVNEAQIVDYLSRLSQLPITTERYLLCLAEIQ